MNKDGKDMKEKDQMRQVKPYMVVDEDVGPKIEEEMVLYAHKRMKYDLFF